MSDVSKELLRKYVTEQNFSSADEVLAALKDLFKDALQESLEAELDESLDYGKHEVSGKRLNNSINGYSRKTVKSELGPISINVPRDRNG